MASWTDVVESFSSATLGTLPPFTLGTTVDLLDIHTDHAVQWEFSYGASESFSAHLEGSFDGTSWFLLGATCTQNSTGSPVTGTVMAIELGKPARYVRAVGYSSLGTAIVSALITSR